MTTYRHICTFVYGWGQGHPEWRWKLHSMEIWGRQEDKDREVHHYIYPELSIVTSAEGVTMLCDWDTGEGLLLSHDPDLVNPDDLKDVPW